MSKIWDISQRLDPQTPTWPGDVELSEKSTWKIEGPSPVNVASVTMSTHSGTHADAPFHYDAGGEKMADVSLDPYLGPCVVVDGRGKDDCVLWSHVEDAVSQHSQLDRFLIRTFEQFPDASWPVGFCAIDPEIILEIGKLGGKLIGTDAPSLDPQNSKELLAHNAVAKTGMAILEGLVLDHVPFGVYELIALPLPLSNLDASPVRAILRK